MIGQILNAGLVIFVIFQEIQNASFALYDLPE